jgi:hypothetical protein
MFILYFQNQKRDTMGEDGDEERYMVGDEATS